jgi:hypothetical protein
VDIADGEFTLGADLIGELFGLPSAEVPDIMRTGGITCSCEHDAGASRGEYRLTFFHRNMRAQLYLDTSGRVLERSVIDFGSSPLPKGLRGRKA